MSMFNRISLRALLTSSIVALALGGCSFSYSSGSAPPSHSHNSGKPLPKKSSPKKVDNREKALPSNSGEKPISKAQPDADPPAPEREVEEVDDAPERTKTAPKRTKGAPKRTPTGDTTETVEADEDVSPSSVGSLKAKPKPKTPPSSQGTLVAPQ